MFFALAGIHVTKAMIAAAVFAVAGAFFCIYSAFYQRKTGGSDSSESAKLRFHIHERSLIVFILDVLFLFLSYYVALMLRFDFVFSSISQSFVDGFLWSMPFWILSAVVMFQVFHLYQSIPRFAGVADLGRLVQAFGSLIPIYLLGAWFMELKMPKFYFLVGYFFSFIAAAAIRFGERLLRFYFHSTPSFNKQRNEAVMIIGAGEGGRLLALELSNTEKLKTKVVCFIDDDPEKIGRLLENVPIVGNRFEIAHAAKKYGVNRIIFAIPSINSRDQREILGLCQQTGCRLQIVPGLYQLVDGTVAMGKMRDVDVEDLLGREQIRVNNDEILSSIQDKTVLVTGAGSIGSELCRQIARSHPKKLVIFEIYENNAYEIQQELKRSMSELDLEILIGSVRNTSRIQAVMKTYKPDLVFHTAAHKHVPLMEDSPNEAIKNNVLGTYKTASAAAAAGVKKFVLISTDKAVNPTNIMGASKRLCEMVVQMMDRCSPDTSFVAVRFGNVLGSNGSVVPLFKKQIAAGGPVTVTDKRIIRYFMTISEAVSLVLQAAFYAAGGEIFVLDMGEPVSIDEMARNLIRLSGFRPDVDIKIEYTGLRPGEKLYEEYLMEEEGLRETDNQLIRIARPIEMDDEAFREAIEELDRVSRGEADPERIRALVSRVVPTYHYTPRV